MGDGVRTWVGTGVGWAEGWLGEAVGCREDTEITDTLDVDRMDVKVLGKSMVKLKTVLRSTAAISAAEAKEPVTLKIEVSSFCSLTVK